MNSPADLKYRLRSIFQYLAGIALLLMVSTATSQAIVLYSQLNNQSSAINTQQYEAGFSTFSNMAADDFVVTGGTWTVNPAVHTSFLHPFCLPVSECRRGGRVFLSGCWRTAGRPLLQSYQPSIQRNR
ncbi:MAG: hypothetical protein ACRERU_18815 [Methylococcales bacterium]